MLAFLFIKIFNGNVAYGLGLLGSEVLGAGTRSSGNLVSGNLNTIE